jgi:hypothetical protein
MQNGKSFHPFNKRSPQLQENGKAIISFNIPYLETSKHPDLIEIRKNLISIFICDNLNDILTGICSNRLSF